MSSSWGERLHVSLFGQSHGEAVGAVIDGLPAGEAVDIEELRRFLRRRAPGQGELSTARRESDEPRILGGLLNGRSCGAPLAVMFENNGARPGDYAGTEDVPRPGHADYPAAVKYRGFQDARGGGHFSGRLTAPLCAAGGVCLQILRRRGIEIAAHLRSVGEAEDRPFDPLGEDPALLERLRTAPLPVLSEESGERMRQAVLRAAAEGDSLGGTVECMVTGLPVGLGGPLFGGLDGKIAAAVFGIPAVKGIEFGVGFAAARLRGSGNNDPYVLRGGRVVTESNHAGGVLGGMSTGMPLLFRAAFKPTPSIALPQKSVKLSTMEGTELCVGGRHDPCVAIRAVPAVEAAAALAVLDALLEG